MNKLKYTHICKFILSSSLALFVINAQSADFSSSFEFTNTSGAFEIGSAPDNAVFTNGVAKSVGNFSLYHSGSNSWMIDAGNTGTITFSSPAETVSLFLKDQNGGVNSVLKVFDASNNELTSRNGNPSSWLSVNLSAAALAAPIAKITLQNNAGDGSSYAVIDDISISIADTPGMPDPVPTIVPIQSGSMRYRLKPVASGLTAPNWGVAAPGDNDHLYISDQDGRLWKINLLTGEKSIFLDLSDRLISLGAFGPGSFDERGFLGFAFHPDYANNGLLYTHTSEPADDASDFSTLPVAVNADHESVIREWQLNHGDNLLLQAQVENMRILIEFDQPQFNHDGGGLNFGPDERLYVALGDGGGADDVDGQPFLGSPMQGHGAEGNGQNNSNPYGTLLRIDPEGNNAGNGQYGIPADNPFIGQNNALDEIFAYGFRNPFRFSFDRENGALYLADVGQNDVEEINIVTAGGNYGWNKKEGSFAFNPNGNEDGSISNDIPAGNFIDPVAQYSHADGVAVIGGFVYRGQTVNTLNGKYVFGDFTEPGGNKGRLFYLENDQIKEFQLTASDQPTINIMGFAQDAHGELYVLGNTTGVPFGNTGVVLKIVANTGFDGVLVNLPVVDVAAENGKVEVYHAKLERLAGIEPLSFRLTADVGKLSGTYAGDNARFELASGRLFLPFVNLTAADGNVQTYSAELQRTDEEGTFILKLVTATRLK